MHVHAKYSTTPPKICNKSVSYTCACSKVLRSSDIWLAPTMRSPCQSSWVVMLVSADSSILFCKCSASSEEVTAALSTLCKCLRFLWYSWPLGPLLLFICPFHHYPWHIPILYLYSNSFKFTQIFKTYVIAPVSPLCLSHWLHYFPWANHLRCKLFWCAR